MLDHGLRNLFLRIYLGIQPSASASHGAALKSSSTIFPDVALSQSLIRYL